MSDSEDGITAEEIQALERILASDNGDNSDDSSNDNLSIIATGTTENEKGSEYTTQNEFSDDDAQNTACMLELNREIIKSLQELKRRVTNALEKIEEKLKTLEPYEDDDSPEAQPMSCNVGIPYFKDRSNFTAPNNDDEILKEKRMELQIDKLPKVNPWTANSRNKLLKGVRQEAISDLLESKENDETDIRDDDSNAEINTNTRSNRNRNKECLSKDFAEMVGPLGEREFDWVNISSNYLGAKHPPMDCRVMWNVYLHPAINKGSWKRAEDNKLKYVAKRYRYQDWEKIATALGTNRTAYQCFVRYNTTKSMPNVQNYIWHVEEDKLLLKLVNALKLGDYVPWGEVASFISNRTKQQLYFRFTYSLSPCLVKGRFTKSEDLKLRQAITRYGNNFRKISASLMPNRSAMQLSDRFQTIRTKLEGNSKLWTIEMDKKLLALYEEFGHSWSKIAKTFPSKNRTQLRHRYNALSKCIKRGIPIANVPRHYRKSEFQQKKEVQEIVSAVPKNGEKEQENSEKALMKRDALTDGNEKDNSERIDENNEDDNEEVLMECTDYELEIKQILKSGLQDDIDRQLVEYFRVTLMPEKSADPEVRRDSRELEKDTKDMYNILQILNANLNIPDNLNNVDLNVEDKRLLNSLKEYAQERTDDDKKQNRLEAYRLRMFGSHTDEKETPYFIPPLPFDTRPRTKMSTNTKTIECNLNKNTKHLIEDPPTEIETPTQVITFIGGTDQELEFQKIRDLLCSHTSKPATQTFVQKLYILPPDVLSARVVKSIKSGKNAVADSSDKTRLITEKQNCATKSQASQNIVSTNLLMEETPYHPRVPYIDTPIIEKLPSLLEASHATVLAFKNLMYLKHMYKTKDSESKKVPKKCHDAYKLLEQRLNILLRRPFGLSQTLVPRVHSTTKRKTRTVTIENSKKRAKLSDTNETVEKGDS